MPEPILICGGYSQEIKFYNVVRGDCVRTVRFDESQVNCLATTPDYQYVAVGGKPYVRFYDIANAAQNMPVTTYDGHTSNVTSIVFEQEGKWFCTGSEDNTVKVWDCRATGFQLCLENNSQVHSVALHPNQAEIVLGDHSGKVAVWDLTVNRTRREVCGEESVPVKSVAVAPDASVAVAANHKGHVYVWQLRDDSFDLLQKIDAHNSYILKCAFSNASKYLATTSADGTTNLWRFQAVGFTRVNTLIGHRKWVWDCVFSADEGYLLTGSSDSTCRLWDANTGQQCLEFVGQKKAVTAVALVDP
mmetsp:Transcript_27030/g.69962  ORF Transcript_27030/g.69962 Transcript_27030/m.69962 type:complete len:303 (-) Transcript_27030:244-1152(-)